MNKFYDMSKINKKDKINFIIGDKNGGKVNCLEATNIKLQQRIFDLENTVLSVIELIKKGNSEKGLKLLKKVMYEK